jgi:hypothetical protein
MDRPSRIALAIFLALAVAIMVWGGFWVLATAPRTGMAILNETDLEARFRLDSDFADGTLGVPPQGRGTFDVAHGVVVPGTFRVQIDTEEGQALFTGTVAPGPDCWTVLTWDGTTLSEVGVKVCH